MGGGKKEALGRTNSDRVNEDFRDVMAIKRLVNCLFTAQVAAQTTTA